ncbi:MAG: hypothetical protein HY694_00295 [Deltaproteobacteria bacterium]|nr:hypothetical protein [Deltaproteobacteria bacterium]
MKKVTLFMGPNKEDNQTAHGLLSKLHDVEIETVGDMVRLNGYVKMPYVEDWRGERYYGLETIQNFFVERELSQKEEVGSKA